MNVNDKLTLQQDLSTSDLVRLRESSIVAVDCEMTGLNPNRDLLCLVQLCDVAGNVTLVQTSHWRTSSLLREFFLDPSIVKVFHFAVNDCSFILKQMGIEVSSAYCTKIASKLARTYSQDHRLATIVQEFFRVQLDKAQQSTYWCGATLTLEQLQYAANDVIWLIELKSKLDKLLEAKGVLPTGISYAELNQQCQAFIPHLVHLRLNGWEIGTDGHALSVFAY